MFIKKLEDVMSLVEKYCKGKDCTCYMNLTNALIQLDEDERKRIKKQMGLKEDIQNAD